METETEGKKKGRSGRDREQERRRQIERWISTEKRRDGNRPRKGA